MAIQCNVSPYLQYTAHLSPAQGRGEGRAARWVGEDDTTEYVYGVTTAGGSQRGFPGPEATDGLKIVRDSVHMGFAFRWNWGSAHSSGAQFLFADGSVCRASFSTPPAAVKSLLTPCGQKELIPDY